MYGCCRAWCCIEEEVRNPMTSARLDWIQGPKRTRQCSASRSHCELDHFSQSPPRFLDSTMIQHFLFLPVSCLLSQSLSPAVFSYWSSALLSPSSLRLCDEEAYAQTLVMTPFSSLSFDIAAMIAAPTPDPSEVGDKDFSFPKTQERSEACRVTHLQHGRS